MDIDIYIFYPKDVSLKNREWDENCSVVQFPADQKIRAVSDVT
jgi:hypothetical protein